jgi:HEXXH motif-containing protein
MSGGRRELTLPTIDTSSTRASVGAALARLVRDVQRMPLGALPYDLRSDARAVLGALGPLSRRSPGVVWSALRRPSVYVHLRLAADGALDPPERLRAGLATLALELAAAGGLEQPLVLRVPPPRLLSRSTGRALAIDPSRPLSLTPQGAALQDGAPCVERPAYVPIDGAIALALEDDSPLAAFEAHPDKQGSLLDLGGQPVATWSRSLADALGRIGRHLPLVREELDLLIQQMVPVGSDPERHLSASYREALGTIYLSLHPDPLTMTEAVLHEAQHDKLNAVLTVEPLLENDPDERYASPVRPDPRPLLGVLLAVHAFIPVAWLYAAMRASRDPLAEGARVEARITQILRGNDEGLSMLERHARPTAVGRALMDELRHWHDRTRSALVG